MVFRILPHLLRAKARAEGPSGNRALLDELSEYWKQPLVNDRQEWSSSKARNWGCSRTGSQSGSRRSA